MSDSAIVMVLLYGHIVSAVGVLGGSLLFAFAIGPVLPRLTPATRGELIVKLLPRVANVITVFGGLLALFGVALAFAITDGDLSQLSTTTGWGLRISIGVVLGLIALIVAMGVIHPAVMEMGRIQAAQPPDASGPPPARFVRLMNRLRAGSILAQITMLGAIAFMVAAASF
jgi:hypothetical protein